MIDQNRIRSPSDRTDKPAVCLSCGTLENMRNRRRYCSIQCRQRLRYKLSLRTGLLKTLNICFATFYFTGKIVVLDVMPFGSKELFSFMYPRTPGKTPADDFSTMADILGNVWWAEKKRSNKNYIASQQLFAIAGQRKKGIGSVQPVEIKIPTIQGAALVYLKLGKADLDAPQTEKVIRTAYRNQAKIHHPDLGGSSESFRKIHKAYEDLIQWAANPSFVKRYGFPDKWFYRGDQNRWVQPIPRP